MTPGMGPRLTTTHRPPSQVVPECASATKKLAADSEDPPAGTRSLSRAVAKPPVSWSPFNRSATSRTVYTAPPRPTKPMPSMAYVKAKRKEEGIA